MSNDLNWESQDPNGQLQFTNHPLFLDTICFVKNDCNKYQAGMTPMGPCYLYQKDIAQHSDVA